MAETKKGVEFCGDSMARLRDFPKEARREAGYQIDKVQEGIMPDRFRPMPSIGSGVVEIKIDENDGTFRVFYVANRGGVLYILHCFQKKTQKTSKKDIDLGKQRYRELP
ncbi:type II toxin-antitoxin system RelE/ParE family toxin [Pistricoccus aurantiacus]|uniref:Type II toxin-antitoxin system RelE/ParE family toxin n=1 Tax=Pistricoccus aurantiacus TaxID=1883414 RepID=A0A5B8SX21_9GAMM|nr:type II toxin-antitoxin system RelE/ParE family toxin [Pistricoccus aurantiacus]QEA39473.1 type II toxin-antitoxin system RelE/ParE family toxin [Pistricoccus aurantiacus]